MHLKNNQVFAKLTADPEPAVRLAAVDCPAWRTFLSYDFEDGLSQFKALSKSIAKDAEIAAAKAKEAQRIFSKIKELLDSQHSNPAP